MLLHPYGLIAMTPAFLLFGRLCAGRFVWNPVLGHRNFECQVKTQKFRAAGDSGPFVLCILYFVLCQILRLVLRTSHFVLCTSCIYSGISRKPFSFFALVGWRSFLSAFASICLTLSLVTLKMSPTSSRVLGHSLSRPNLS